MEYIINTVKDKNNRFFTIGEVNCKINADARKVMIDFLNMTNALVTDIIK
jgi:hypothetical protein